MPAIEQQHPTEHLTPNITLPRGLHDVQRETWASRVTGYVQPTQTNALNAFGSLEISSQPQENSIRGWCAKPFSEFQAPTGLKNAEKELEQSKGSLRDHGLAVEVGTVKSVYSMGNSAVAIGNAVVSPPARLGNWLANSIKDPATAASDSAKLGDDIRKTMAICSHALDEAHAYVEQVRQAQIKGDYLKPVADATHEMQALTDKLAKLTPVQKTEALSEQVVSLGAQIATGKILSSASNGFASLLDKMDQFKIKSDAHRLQFCLEDKAATAEKTKIADEFKESAVRHHEQGEKHVAGARNSRFGYEEIDPYRSLDVPIQCHDNACVAACGEMLTEGRISQHSFVERLEQYLPSEQDRGKQNPLPFEALAPVLGPDWSYMTIKPGMTQEQLFDKLLSTKHPFAITFKAYKVRAHAVVVDGLNEAGRMVIRDPAEGKIVQLKVNEFLDSWSLHAVAKKQP